MKLSKSLKEQPNSEKTETDIKCKDAGRWRDLTSYWIFGLCNNYGYVVMLSAAHDIIGRIHSYNSVNLVSDDKRPETERICNIISTGAILLADIIPAFIAMLLSPFLPLYINFRIFMACLIQAIGFLMVAFADTEWMAITGVALTSFSSGLGEVTFLSYSAKFHKNVISTWSSGTGGAGIFGSFSYAALISYGVTPFNTMLIMLAVPIIEAGTFWLLLRSPCTNSINESDNSSQTNDVESGKQKIEFTLLDKICYMPSLLKYMIPYALVFLFQYFINQGLMELIHFKNIWIDRESQYRWLQFDYQIGVFISRSSVNLLQINKIWLMTIFQFLNVVFILTEVLTFFSPTIWLVFAVVLWEGLLGGSTYVNTYYRMSKEIPEERRNFALGIVPVSDSIGIAIAGIIAIPTHNAICRMPIPARF